MGVIGHANLEDWDWLWYDFTQEELWMSYVSGRSNETKKDNEHVSLVGNKRKGNPKKCSR